MAFFHVTQIQLAPRSIILPGNWGRILRLYNRSNVGEVLYREKSLEDIRRLEFPNKPSRLNSVFMLETVEEARHFRDQTNSFALIYRLGSWMNLSRYTAVIITSVLLKEMKVFWTEWKQWHWPTGRAVIFSIRKL